jgi:hypothetical protein
VRLRHSAAPQADFFLQDQATLDHEDLFDNRDYGGVPLLSDGRSGVDWPPYRDALDFDRLVSQGFVNEVIMTDGADMHPNTALDFASRNRKLLTIKRENLLFDERRLRVLTEYL